MAHTDPNRREFLGEAGCAAGVLAGNAFLLPAAAIARAFSEQTTTRGSSSRRATQCTLIKKDAALANARMPTPANRPNDDEQLHPFQIGSYHKGLQHNEIGEVDTRAYRALLHALETGHPADFEKIPLGGKIKLSTLRAASHLI